MNYFLSFETQNQSGIHLTQIKYTLKTTMESLATLSFGIKLYLNGNKLFEQPSSYQSIIGINI